MGASGPNKWATLAECLLGRESWTTALSLSELRAKGSPPGIDPGLNVVFPRHKIIGSPV
jgi:hypothetical protein